MEDEEITTMAKATRKKASRLDREIDDIAARVRRSRQYSFGELRRQTWVESEAATTRETEKLLEDIETGADGLVVARTWTVAVQLDLANLVADSPGGAEVRFVIGAWIDHGGGADGDEEDEDDGGDESWDPDQDLDDDPDLEDEDEDDQEVDVEYIGVRDPGGVADEAVCMITRIGRDCDVRVVTHLGIRAEGRVVHLVEVTGAVQ